MAGGTWDNGLDMEEEWRKIIQGRRIFMSWARKWFKQGLQL